MQPVGKMINGALKKNESTFYPFKGAVVFYQ